jgi:hypothetical protein
MIRFEWNNQMKFVCFSFSFEFAAQAKRTCNAITNTNASTMLAWASLSQHLLNKLMQFATSERAFP